MVDKAIQKPNKDSFRVNESIAAKHVQVVDQNGTFLGNMDIAAALSLASQAQLDLVEVSPTSTPPICKITDAAKLRYDQKKKAQAAKKNQKRVHLKEIRLRPQIEAHDLEVKLNSLEKFISEGCQVKLYVRFKGREIVFSNQGRELLEKVWDRIKDTAVKDAEPRLEGKQMSMRVSPKR